MSIFSQGIIATRLRCSGIFNDDCIPNLPLSFSVKKRLRIA